MKGLLLKDFLTISKQLKVFLLILVVFALVPGYSLSAYAVIFASMMPLTALAYDERCKWDEYAAMLPCGDKRLVLSKYLLGWLGMLAAAVLSLGAQAVLSAFGRGAFGGSELLSLLFVACAGLLIQSVSLPCVFRFGAEKGRLVLMVTVVACTMAIIAVGEKFDAMSAVGAMENGGLTLAATIAPIAAVLASAVSLGVSMKVYQKRKG